MNCVLQLCPNCVLIVSYVFFLLCPNCVLMFSRVGRLSVRSPAPGPSPCPHPPRPPGASPWPPAGPWPPALSRWPLAALAPGPQASCGLLAQEEPTDPSWPGSTPPAPPKFNVGGMFWGRPQNQHRAWGTQQVPEAATTSTSSSTLNLGVRGRDMNQQ